MSNPQYEAAKEAVKDALRIGMKYHLSALDIKQKIMDKLRGIGAVVGNTGLILLTVRDNTLQASLTVRFTESGRTCALNVQKRGQFAGWLVEQAKKPVFDTSTAIKLINSLKPGDKVNVVFANETFGGDLNGRIMMLLAGFRDTVDFGDDGMGVLQLMAVAQSGRWAGFRTYTLTIREGFDAEYFISRTIARSLIECIEKVSESAEAIA